MTNSQQHPDPVSDKRLKYLRALAARTGESFIWPQNARQASEEIDRLEKRARTSRADRDREAREIARDMATHRGDAARVRVDDEVGGYGSSAHWR